MDLSLVRQSHFVSLDYPWLDASSAVNSYLEGNQAQAGGATDGFGPVGRAEFGVER